jgi:hypothetical protein
VLTVCPGYLRTAITAANDFAMPGLMDPAQAVPIMLKAIAKGQEHIVVPRRTGWLARLLDLLPEKLHDRLLASQPRKPRVGEAGGNVIPGLNNQAARIKYQKNDNGDKRHAYRDPYRASADSGIAQQRQPAHAGDDCPDWRRPFPIHAGHAICKTGHSISGL